MVKQGPIMVEEVDESDDEDFSHKHKHHMKPQIPSRTSKVLATHSHKTLTPWSC
jgi:ABC-type polysaccharide/polyol phosphate transport system ATPase subunit